MPCLTRPHSIFPKSSISPLFICLVKIGILSTLSEVLTIVGTLSKAAKSVLSLYHGATSEETGVFTFTPVKPSTPAQNIFSESNPQFFLKNG